MSLRPLGSGMFSSTHSSALRRRCTIHSQFSGALLDDQERNSRGGLRQLAQSLSANSGASGRLENTERLWKEFFADPSQWWDDRRDKTHPKSPDFKHRFTRHALWIDSWSNPPWVTIKLNAMSQDKTPHYGGANIQVPQGVAGQDSSRLSVHDPLGWREHPHAIGTERLRQGVNNSSINTSGHRRILMKKGEAMAILHRFDQQGILVHSPTYIKVLQMCCKLHDLEAGKQVHDHIIKSGVQPNISVVNNLMKMYIDCGSVVDARQLFDKLVKKDAYTWTIMIGSYVQNKYRAETFEVFRQMLQEGVEPDRITYMSILNACDSPVALEWGKEVHAQALRAGLGSDVRVGTALVKMYAKCGSIQDARLVFDQIVKRDLISWTVMIGAYAESGLCFAAFRVFLQMQQEGVEPDAITYISVLNACASPIALERGTEVHTQAVKAGLDADVRVGTAIVKMYAKCGSIMDAKKVFDKIVRHDVISLTVMIGACAESGQHVRMLNECDSPVALEWGREVHNQARKAGFASDVRLGTALLKMYAKCGSIKDARNVFEKMLNRDVISWTMMIGAYAESGHGDDAFRTFLQMKQEGLEPDAITYMSILNTSASPGALEWVKVVHAQAVKTGLESDIRVGNAFLNMFAKCGSIQDARQVFDKMVKRDLISWTVMIGAYAESGHGEEAFETFLQMRQEGLEPDAITYMSILNPCASPGALEWVKKVHTQAVKAGLESDVRVCNAFVNMYVKCGRLADAYQVFDKMVVRDVISWNVMIGGYAESGHFDKTFESLVQMRQGGLEPDAITYMRILNACASPVALEWGKEVHAQAVKAGLESDVRVGTALVRMYAKCGSIKDARKLFDKMVKHDIVPWNVMIGVYAESGHGDEAFDTFLQMCQEGLEPDTITYLSILHPCASLGALEWVKEVHAHAVKARLEFDVCVGNAFVNMYAKCGSIQDARQVFDKLAKRDVISWNMMIGGLAQHGCCQDALEVFEQMKREGVRPDEVTFVGVLSACAHSGLVDECRRQFSSLSEDYGIIPTIEHYGCMVDLLGRAGHLDEAENIIKNMPLEAGVPIWGALLAGCRIHGNVKLAEHAAEQCLKLEPENAGAYVLLSNVYAAAGMWDNVMLVRNMMKERSVMKEPGRSWIRVDRKLHSFVAEDRSHPQAEEVYDELKRITRKLKRAGYVPDIRFVMHDVDEQQKAEAICFHSEKLAIAYGLISTPPGTPICIFKNLRVCLDCHTATKFISKLTDREIVARDTNRFHHFKDGVCSCGDYW